MRIDPYRWMLMVLHAMTRDEEIALEGDKYVMATIASECLFTLGHDDTVDRLAHLSNFLVFSGAFDGRFLASCGLVSDVIAIVSDYGEYRDWHLNLIWLNKE